MFLRGLARGPQGKAGRVRRDGPSAGTTPKPWALLLCSEIAMQKRFFCAVLVILSFSLPLCASTVAPPDNLGQLARLSKAVVFAQALESWSEDGGTIPVTVTRFQLLEKVAGADPGAIFEVREPGGRIGKKGAAIAGAPRFSPESN